MKELANALMVLLFAVALILRYLSFAAGDAAVLQEQNLIVLAVFYVFMAAILALLLGVYMRITRMPVTVSSLAVVAVLVLLISAALGGVGPTPMVLIGGALTLVISSPAFADCLAFASRNVLRSCVILTAIYLATPVVLFIGFDISDVGGHSLTFADSFRGFAGSRTDFGFLTGLILIILVIENPRRISSVAMLLLLGYGLLISESRAAMFGLFCGVLVFAISFRGRQHLGLFALLASFAAAVLFYFRPGTAGRNIDLLTDSGARTEIVERAVAQVMENPIFGAGGFYQQVGMADGLSIEAHNSLLQGLLNFGLIGTVLWCLILARLFLSVRPAGRCLLTYEIIFGLFQPGLDPFLLLPDQLLVICLAISFSNLATRKSAVVGDGRIAGSMKWDQAAAASTFRTSELSSGRTHAVIHSR